MTTKYTVLPIFILSSMSDGAGLQVSPEGKSPLCPPGARRASPPCQSPQSSAQKSRRQERRVADVSSAATKLPPPSIHGVSPGGSALGIQLVAAVRSHSPGSVTLANRRQEDRGRKPCLRGPSTGSRPRMSHGSSVYKSARRGAEGASAPREPGAA